MPLFPAAANLTGETEKKLSRFDFNRFYPSEIDSGETRSVKRM